MRTHIVFVSSWYKARKYNHSFLLEFLTKCAIVKNSKSLKQKTRYFKARQKRFQSSANLLDVFIYGSSPNVASQGSARHKGFFIGIQSFFCVRIQLTYLTSVFL